MSKQVKCTVENDFHNTSVSFRAPAEGGTLTRSQTKRIFKTLCGMSNCCCGGIRGPQDEMPDGLAIGYKDSEGCLEILQVETTAERRAKEAALDSYYVSRYESGN